MSFKNITEFREFLTYINPIIFPEHPLSEKMLDILLEYFKTKNEDGFIDEALSSFTKLDALVDVTRMDRCGGEGHVTFFRDTAVKIIQPDNFTLYFSRKDSFCKLINYLLVYVVTMSILKKQYIDSGDTGDFTQYIFPVNYFFLEERKEGFVLGYVSNLVNENKTLDNKKEVYKDLLAFVKNLNMLHKTTGSIIVHGDLKLDNILWDNGAKIIDFGISSISLKLQDGEMLEHVGFVSDCFEQDPGVIAPKDYEHVDLYIIALDCSNGCDMEIQNIGHTNDMYHTTFVTMVEKFTEEEFDFDEEFKQMSNFITDSLEKNLSRSQDLKP